MSARTTTAPTQRDYRDLVIAQLADDLALEGERVASLEADNASYRELAKQAIHVLATVSKQRDNARRRLYALLDERRVQSHQRAA